MPVNTLHSACEGMREIWRKCRDVYAGQEAIHSDSRREHYLPKFKNESPQDYAARVKRSVFFNAFFRTVQGLTGMLFLTPPKVEVSARAQAMLDDVTQAGQSLADLAKEVATEALKVGRVGVLVDYPRTEPGEALTVAQAEASGRRPRMVLYLAESIINWDTREVAGRSVLSQVVLYEVCCERDPNDRFCAIEYEQCRVLELDDDGEVFVELWRAGEKGEWYVHSSFYPTMAGKPLTEIPFVFISSDSTRPHVEEPPLIDLVNMNISHYQSTADAEHGAHKTAMPQVWITGIDGGGGPDGAPAMEFYIGGGSAWTLPTDAQVGMLEYQGQGLGAIEVRIQKKEDHMAVLGARMLEAQKKGVETAEVAGMHRSGEQSALTTQAETIDSGLTRALAWFDRWAGGSGDVSFALNKEFLPTKLSPDALRSLVETWQAGGLSPQEFYEQLQTGGIVDPDKTYEEHEAQVDAAAPAVQPITAPAGGSEE